jgi:tetratricopeptide (TPR) repeat protein
MMKMELLLSTGISYLEREQYSEALTNFELVLIEKPGSPDALFGRGMCRIALGNNEDGIVDIQKAANNGSIAAREYLRYRQSSSIGDSHDIPKYDGVKGWLALFCGLLILSNSIDLLRSINVYHGLALLISMVASIWGISSAVILIKKMRYCVTNAKIYISVMIILNFYSILYSRQVADDTHVTQVILYTAWLIYFFTSKRVKITYRDLDKQ